MNKAVLYIPFLILPSLIHSAVRLTITDMARKHRDSQCHLVRIGPFAKEGLDQTTKEVLINFGNVIGNFFTLLQNTNNPQHVGNCLQGMIAGMVNIGVAAMKKHHLLENSSVDTSLTPAEIAGLVSGVQESLLDIITIKRKKCGTRVKALPHVSLSSIKNKQMIM